jgi:hypothetical protein
MKLLIVRLSIALLTFVVGFTAHTIWSGKDYIIDRCGAFIIRGMD